MFIGREVELKQIEESLRRHEYQGVFVYGRRRVGKTELITKGIANVTYRVLQFEFRKTTLLGNLRLFVPFVREFFADPYVDFSSFDALFDYLLMKSESEEYVLVLDEFSFLLAEDFTVESSLASAIDGHKRNSKLHLFISGSYIGLMEKMIDQPSHSYGRFQRIICLRPFDYYDSAKFYPEYSPEDKIMLYSVFGGVAYFNAMIDGGKSALENIFDLVIRADSICEHEIEGTIMAETTKAPQLNELLLTIVRGNRKYTDIASDFAAQGKTKPDYFLEKLIDLDFIAKVAPINDEGNRRRIHYRIKDNLVDFYFRYLFTSRTKELRNEPEFYFKHFIEKDFVEQYLPHKFEEISKQFLMRMNFSGRIEPVFFKIGEYFIDSPRLGINRQFDVVTEDEQGYVAYECKYRDAPVCNQDIHEEEFQTKNLPDITFRKLGFIAKNGFDPEVDLNKIIAFSLNDFYL